MDITKDRRNLILDCMFEQNWYRAKRLGKGETKLAMNCLLLKTERRGDWMPITYEKEEVGFILLEWIESAKAKDIDVVLHQIYVKPTFRRRGLASKALKRVADAFGYDIRYGAYIQDRNRVARLFLLSFIDRTGGEWIRDFPCIYDKNDVKMYGFRVY